MHELEKAPLLIHSALAFGRRFQVAMAVCHRFMKFGFTVCCLQLERGEAGCAARTSARSGSPILRAHAELIERDKD